MFRQLKEDIACVRERDPAARSVLEVLLLYPGLKASGCTAGPTGAIATGCFSGTLDFPARRA